MILILNILQIKTFFVRNKIMIATFCYYSLIWHKYWCVILSIKNIKIIKKMKKISVLWVLVALIATSCSLTKENMLYRSKIKGDWKLVEIAYEGAKGQFSTKLFQDANADCFEGSDWSFNANNSLGSYELNGGQDCIAGRRDIRWSVFGGDNLQQLQFKFVDEKHKAITNTGFRLDIDYIDEAKMRLHTDVNVENEIVRVVYKFQKK